MNYRYLQEFSDEIEMRLRSLAALGEEVQDAFIINIFKSNLPTEAITTLELQRGDDDWTVEFFRKKFKLYLRALEPSKPESVTQPVNKPFFQPNYQANSFQTYRPQFSQPTQYNPSGGYRPTQPMVTSNPHSSSTSN